MSTKIVLVTGSPVLDLNTLVGVLDQDAVVVFDAEPEIVAEHLVAAGRRDLIPLLTHIEEGIEIAYSPETGERIEIPVDAELATEFQVRDELNKTNIFVLKKQAKDLDIDLGDATTKAAIIEKMLPFIGTKEVAEKIGIDSGSSNSTNSSGTE